MASGINSTFRQVGIATGIAGLGAVFQHDVTQQHHRRAARQRPRARQISAPPTGSSRRSLESGEVAHVRALAAVRRAHGARSTPTAWASRARSRRSRSSPAVWRSSAARSHSRSCADATSSAPGIRRRRRTRARASPRARSPAEPMRGRVNPRRRLRRAAHSPGTRALAAADSADRPGPRASACTARTSSRACCARAAGARMCRTAQRATAVARSRRRAWT